MPPFIAWISLDQPNKLIGYLLAVVMTIKSATHDVKIPPENQAPRDVAKLIAWSSYVYIWYCSCSITVSLITARSNNNIWCARDCKGKAYNVTAHSSLIMERTNNNCVVHVRQDSDTDLEALFHVVNPTTVPNSHPDTTPANSLPMRLRKLPPSFFKQPPIDGGLSPETDHPLGLQISHSRAHSSPASITVPSSLKGPPNHSLSSVVHQRSTSFDNTALLEEPAQMPPGWEIRSTPNGQHYFMK